MAKPQNFLLRPRYLRAIPSLVVLTTTMAWGVAPDPAARIAASRKANIAHIHDAGELNQNPRHARLVGIKPAA